MEVQVKGDRIRVWHVEVFDWQLSCVVLKGENSETT
jgi:hypothetical protein